VSISLSPLYFLSTTAYNALPKKLEFSTLAHIKTMMTGLMVGVGRCKVSGKHFRRENSEVL
jgi:hypothetical protein